MALMIHNERHFAATAAVRDVVIGMSDGLTVPFALAAGLTGVVGIAPWTIVIAGLAEISAGAIAMGLGGYLAARTDYEHFQSERAVEEREVKEKPEVEVREVAEVFEAYGMTPEQIAPIVAALQKDEKRWIDFMMKFELGLDKPDPRRAIRSAATIAASYVVGGLIPLMPYVFIQNSIPTALWISVAVTLLALLIFGMIKGRLTKLHPLRSGLQTALIGGLAAAAAFFIAFMVQRY